MIGARYLVVHPRSSCDLRRQAEAGWSPGPMPAASAPNVGMAMRVPVRRRSTDGLLDLRPSLEALAFERQGAQRLPPRFDEIQVGGVRGLEDKLPARMGEGEQQHVGGPMGTQIV